VNARVNKKASWIDLGLKDYKETWDYQTDLFNKTLQLKSENRGLPQDHQHLTPNHIITCEHPHVYTLGKSGKPENLLVDDAGLERIGATYYHINRGGDITYHGPGQLVLYPVLDLENLFTDIHKYMRLLEEAVIRTLERLGISSGRIDGLTGVWVDFESPAKARKICAMGVKTSRWVTMHGLALNVNADLSYFSHIIPCGIQDKAVTSMHRELDALMDIDLVKRLLVGNLAELFDLELT
jgi:lipoyl(octanoyl) transferase